MKKTGRWQDYRSGVSGWRRLLEPDCVWIGSRPDTERSPSQSNAGTRAGGGELHYLVPDCWWRSEQQPDSDQQSVKKAPAATAWKTGAI